MPRSRVRIARRAAMLLAAVLFAGTLATLNASSASATEPAPTQTDTRSWHGGFTATWLIPDGTVAPLRYEVRYGTASGTYTQSKDAGLATQVNVNATNGTTYYVVVAAFYPAGVVRLSNEMTALPLANGATVVSDDFGDGESSGWTAVSGSWGVTAGRLTGSGSIVTGPRPLFNVAIEATITTGTGAAPNGLILRAQGPGDYYSLVVSDDDQMRIQRTAGGTTTTLVSRYYPLEPGQRIRLRFEGNGYTLRGLVDGERVVLADDVTFPTGQVGVRGGTAIAVAADDVAVTAMAKIEESPNAVNTATRKSALLSGWWNLTTSAGVRTNTRVPDCWSCVSPHGGDSAVYERYFTVPATFGSRIELEFEQVTEWATVTLNGTVIGSHKGEGLPFAFDITDEVLRGSTANLLRVEVSRGDNHWPTGWDDREADLGIRGDVWLRSHADVHVDDVAIRTSVANGEIEIEATIANAGTTPRTVDLALAALHGGSTVKSFTSLTGIVVPAGSSETVVVTRPWSDAHLWSPEDPYLHTLSASLSDSGGVMDVATQRFGFREFVVDGTDYRLNGAPYNLRGDSIVSHGSRMQLETGGFQPQDFYLQWSTAARARATLEAYQDLNVNVLRTHMGPAAGRHFYDLADELGMLIIDESPIWGSWGANVPPSTTDADGRTGVQTFAAWIEAWMIAQRNHPSIVQWSLGNENPSPTAAWTKTLYDVAKATDPTRPASYDPFGGPCWPADRSDVCVRHYTAPNSHDGTGLPGNGYIWGFAPYSSTRPSSEGEFAWNGGNPSAGHAALTLGYRYAGFADVRPYRLTRQILDSVLPQHRYAEDTAAITRAMAAIGVYDMRAETAVLGCPADAVSSVLDGGELTRRLLVFNDDSVGTAVDIDWELHRGSTLIASGTRPATIPLGAHAEFDLVIAAPGIAVGDTVRFSFSSSKSGIERFAHEIALKIVGPESELVADDGDCGYADSGNWTTSTSSGYGGDHRIGSAAPAKWATYRFPQTPLDGEYEVWLYWTAAPTNATNSEVRIYHVGGTLTGANGAYDRFLVDQTAGSAGGEFHRVGGTFQMDAGDYVGIDSTGANGTIQVDAVRLVRVG